MDRYLASIDGFALDVETIDDTIDKAIAVYEYPYRDGGDTDDLGENAHGIKLRCYWWEETYDQHVLFLDHLKQRELFSLTHPKYGVKKGRIRSISIRHDDRQRLAEVDLQFVEDLASQEQPPVFDDMQSLAEEQFLASLDEQRASYMADAIDRLGSQAIDLTAAELDPALTVTEQFTGISLTVRNWLKGIDAAVATWEAVAVDVANPANTLLASVSFATDIPGRLIGSAARAAERYALALASLRSAPARFISTLHVALDEFVALDGDHGKVARQVCAARLAMEGASLYAEDETARDTYRRAEKTRAFDAAGRYVGQPLPPAPLSAVELERSLAEIRTVLQAAIDEDRTAGSLKTIARALLEHVSQVKLERDRLTTVVLDNPMPLHLICLQQGLPYSYAVRLLAINAIAHPNEVRGEVSVYVR